MKDGEDIPPYVMAEVAQAQSFRFLRWFRQMVRAATQKWNTWGGRRKPHSGYQSSSPRCP